MPRKKKPPISIIEQIKKLQNAKIADNKKYVLKTNIMNTMRLKILNSV